MVEKEDMFSGGDILMSTLKFKIDHPNRSVSDKDRIQQAHSATGGAAAANTVTTRAVDVL